MTSLTIPQNFNDPAKHMDVQRNGRNNGLISVAHLALLGLVTAAVGCTHYPTRPWKTRMHDTMHPVPSQSPGAYSPDGAACFAPEPACFGYHPTCWSTLSADCRCQAPVDSQQSSAPAGEVNLVLTPPTPPLPPMPPMTSTPLNAVPTGHAPADTVPRE